MGAPAPPLPRDAPFPLASPDELEAEPRPPEPPARTKDAPDELLQRFFEGVNLAPEAPDLPEPVRLGDLVEHPEPTVEVRRPRGNLGEWRDEQSTPAPTPAAQEPSRLQTEDVQRLTDALSRDIDKSWTGVEIRNPRGRRDPARPPTLETPSDSVSAESEARPPGDDPERTVVWGDLNAEMDVKAAWKPREKAHMRRKGDEEGSATT